MNRARLANAIRAGNINEVKALIESKVIYDPNHGLDDASSRGYTDIVEFLLKRRANDQKQLDRSLKVASYKWHFDIIKMLLEAKADVHTHDDYILRNAVISNKYDVVKLLLDAKANVHALNGASLEHASTNGNLDMVKLLIEYKADIHANNDISLKRASGLNNYNVVSYLIDNKADIKKLNVHYIKFIPVNVNTLPMLLELDNAGIDLMTVGSNIGYTKYLAYKTSIKQQVNTILMHYMSSIVLSYM